MNPKYYVAPRRKKKREPNVIKDFEIMFRGYNMHVYVLDNDDWIIESEIGVPDVSIFGDARTYAETEGFVDDLR